MLDWQAVFERPQHRLDTTRAKVRPCYLKWFGAIEERVRGRTSVPQKRFPLTRIRQPQRILWLADASGRASTGSQRRPNGLATAPTDNLKA